MTRQPALVIEDDDVVRMALVRQLQALGFEPVLDAADGEEALHTLEGPHAFDVIISDLRLPGLDAVEFLRHASRRQARARVVLVSALDDALLRTVAVLCRGRGLQVVGALRKPVGADALAELLADVRPEPAAEMSSPPAEDVRRALEQRLIGMRVQPKVNTADGTLSGVEALAHWVDPRHGAVYGARLLSLVEWSGQSRAFADLIVSLALRHCAAWQEAGMSVPVSVNLSASALQDLDLPERIGKMLRSLGVSPEMLAIEVGEHGAVDKSAVLDVLARLRMRGVQVAVDNFGLGQASPQRLQRLPVSQLKLDQSVVRGLPSSPVSRIVAEYGVKLAAALGLVTVAVGVETREQADALASLGCRVFQGHYIAKPMMPDELLPWAASLRAPATRTGADHGVAVRDAA